MSEIKVVLSVQSCSGKQTTTEFFILTPTMKIFIPVLLRLPDILSVMVMERITSAGIIVTTIDIVVPHRMRQRHRHGLGEENKMHHCIVYTIML